MPWGLNTGLQAWSQCASRRYCDRPPWGTLSVAFLGPSANAQNVPKIHTALHTSRASLPIVVCNLPPNSNSPNAMTIRHSYALQLQNSKIQANCSTAVLCCTLPAVHFPSCYLFHCPKFYIASSEPSNVSCCGDIMDLYSADTCCKPCLWYWRAGCMSSWAHSVQRRRNTRPTRLPLRSSCL